MASASSLVTRTPASPVEERPEDASTDGRSDETSLLPAIIRLDWWNRVDGCLAEGIRRRRLLGEEGR
jgi:hypothetical protein